MQEEAKEGELRAKDESEVLLKKLKIAKEENKNLENKINMALNRGVKVRSPTRKKVNDEATDIKLLKSIVRSLKLDLQREKKKRKIAEEKLKNALAGKR